MVVVGILRAGAVFKQDVAVHAELGGEGGGLTGMVRLRRALRDDHVGAFGLGFGHQEFELARLVAAGRQPRAVVALDPDLRPAQFARQAVEPLQWRWQMREMDSRKARQMHDRCSPVKCRKQVLRVTKT